MNVTVAEKVEETTLHELGKKFIGGTMWMSTAQIASYGLTFGANILLARLLAPDVFGIFALAMSILSILYILGSWSFSVAVIQTEEFDQAFFDTAFALSLGLGGALFILAAIATFPLRLVYSDQVVRIFLILAGLQVLTLLSSCYGATLKRDLEYKSVSLIQIGARVLGLIIAVALAWKRAGVWSLVAKQSIFVISNFVGMCFISPWRFRWQFDIDAAKRLFRFGLQMFASSGLESLFSNIQGFLIGTMLGTTMLGYFDRALQLSQMGNTVAGSAVNQVSLATFSRLQTSKGNLSQAFEIINYFLIRTFVLLGALFFLFGEDVIVFLYGERWRGAGRIAPFLSVFVVTAVIFENAKHLFYSTSRIKEVIRIRIIQSLLLVIGTLISLQIYGLVGAASVLSLLYLLGTLFLLWAIRLQVDVRFQHIFLPPTLAGGVVVILFKLSLFMIKKGKGSVESSLIIASGCLVILMYLGVLWLLEKEQLKRYISNLSGVL